MAHEITQKRAHPKIQTVIIQQLSHQTDCKSFPFFRLLLDNLKEGLATFFPNLTVKTEDVSESLEALVLKQDEPIIAASEIYDVVLKQKLQPPSDTCLLILTDMDLLPEVTFSATRQILRTSIVSYARLDPMFPEVSPFRAHGRHSEITESVLQR